MSKRFIDSDLFDDEWFCDLSKDAKLAWIYLITKCDHAGIFDKSYKLAEFQLSIKSFANALVELGERIVDIGDNKIFIPKFITFQYSNGLNEKVSTHSSVIRQLKKYKLDYKTFEMSGVRDSVPDNVKNYALLRDGKKCVYCGKEINNFELTYNQLLPIKLGGKATMENIVVCCKNCNSSKGDSPLDVWIEKNGLTGTVPEQLVEQFYRTLKDKDKDKDKDIDMGKDTDKDANIDTYISIGKYVRLTQESLSRLEARFGKLAVSNCAETMNDWIASKGKKPFSDYEAALRNWLKRDSSMKKSEAVKF